MFGKKKDGSKFGYMSEMLYQLRELYTMNNHLLWEDKFLGSKNEIDWERKSLRTTQALIRMTIRSIIERVIGKANFFIAEL